MDGRCRRHPDHRQAKGVCPFCLREKLNTLSASSSAATTIASSTTSSSAKFTGSGLSSVVAGSPPHDQDPPVVAAISATVPSLKPEMLKKSRSLAFSMGTQIGGDQDAERKEKGKQKKRMNERGGFWSKLMMTAGSHKRKQVNEDMLQYSKTLKEKPGAKWVIF